MNLPTPDSEPPAAFFYFLLQQYFDRDKKRGQKFRAMFCRTIYLCTCPHASVQISAAAEDACLSLEVAGA